VVWFRFIGATKCPEGSAPLLAGCGKTRDLVDREASPC
jgi:hypothetical protein